MHPRTLAVTALAGALLVAAGLTGCGSDQPAAPEPTTSATASPSPSPTATATPTTASPTTSPTTVSHTEDPALALQQTLTESLGANADLVGERSDCPASNDLACLVEVTSRIGDQARADIPLLEAAVAAGGAPCLQQVALLHVQVLEQYLEQDRLYTENAPGPYPLDELTAANDAIPALQDQQDAALDTC